MVLGQGQQYLPSSVEGCGQPRQGASAVGNEMQVILFIWVGPGHQPSLQDRLLSCNRELGVEWRPARGQENRLVLGRIIAAGVLAPPPGGAGNWGPPVGHPVAASCREGPTLS